MGGARFTVKGKVIFSDTFYWPGEGLALRLVVSSLRSSIIFVCKSDEDEKHSANIIVGKYVTISGDIVTQGSVPYRFGREASRMTLFADSIEIDEAGVVS